MAPSPEQPQLVVIADDLSGAAESASQVIARGGRNLILLCSPDGSIPGGGANRDQSSVPTLTLDTGTRAVDPAARVAAMKKIAGSDVVRDAGMLVLKVDSLLRGQPGLSVAALCAQTGRVPVVCTALPSLGRTVVNGVVRVNDQPLHHTDLWAVEASSPPTTVAEALAPVPLHQVRIESHAWRPESGVGVTADATSVDDLDRLVRRARSEIERPLFVGSAAMVDAVNRVFRGAAPASKPMGVSVESMMFVIGTRSAVVGDQIAALAALGADVQWLTGGDLLSGRAQLPPPGNSPIRVIALDPTAPAVVDRSRALLSALVRLVLPQARTAPALMCTGGETARALLDELGCLQLDVVGTFEHGTVLSRTEQDQYVVTRPGSFGQPDSLVRLATSLVPGFTIHHQEVR